MADQEVQLLQRHFANLRHIRDVFRIDPRAQRGTGQIAPWLSGVVQLVHPAFPGSFQSTPTEVRAFADPAAGADFTTQVSPNEIWRIEALRFVLVTDATAVNRFALLQFNDTVNTFMEVAPQAAQAASLTHAYNWGLQQGYEKLSSTNQIMGLPGLFLQPGWTVRTNASLQAADQISDVVLLVEVYPV